MSLALGRTESDIMFPTVFFAEPRGGAVDGRGLQNQHFTRMWNEENKSKRASFVTS